MRNFLNRRDTEKEVVSNLEDLPNFDLMSDDEVTQWWEHNEVSAEILATLEDTGEETNFGF